MRKILALIAVLALAAPFVSAHAETAYCAGFESGYAEGYCYQQFGCIAPIPPICPLERINESTYQDGYNRGFIAGRAAHENQ